MVVNNKPMTILKELCRILQLTTQYSIYCLPIPTLKSSMYVVDMYVIARFAMMEFLKMLRRLSKALFGEDK